MKSILRTMSDDELLHALEKISAPLIGELTHRGYKVSVKNMTLQADLVDDSVLHHPQSVGRARNSSRH